MTSPTAALPQPSTDFPTNVGNSLSEARDGFVNAMQCAGGHIYHAVKCTLREIVVITDDPETIEKTAKIALGIILSIQVLGVKLGEILKGVQKSLSGVVKVIGARNLFVGIQEFTNGFKKGGIFEKGVLKVLSRLFYRLSNIFETFDFIYSLGVDTFANLSSLCGGTTVFGELGQIAFSEIKKPFLLVSSLLALTDAGMSIAKNWKDPKAWLTVTGDLAKIALVTLGSLYFSLGFAALILVQAGSSLTKHFIRRWEEMHRPAPPPPPIPSQEIRV